MKSNINFGAGRIYTTEQFAELYGWTEEVVRQKCRRQEDPRSGCISQLPDGFEAEKSGGDWYIYRVGRNTNVAGIRDRIKTLGAKETRRREFQRALDLKPLFNWTDFGELRQPYAPLKSWLEYLESEFDWSFATRFKRHKESQKRGRKLRLFGFSKLLNLLRDCMTLATKRGEVSITLQFRHNQRDIADSVTWRLTSIDKPNDEPLLWLSASDDARLALLIREWANEIHAHSYSGTIPSERATPTDPDDPEDAICCECGTRPRNELAKYCSATCRDRHGKWIRAAALAQGTHQAQMVQDRLAMLLRKWSEKTRNS